MTQTSDIFLFLTFFLRSFFLLFLSFFLLFRFPFLFLIFFFLVPFINLPFLFLSFSCLPKLITNRFPFPTICGPGGSKSRLAKAAGAEPSGGMRDEKLHALVARSAFRSQKGTSTTCSDHFWKLRCSKNAQHFGTNDIWKSKSAKQTAFGALLDVEMLKKCTALWREAHFQVKTPGSEHFWKLRCSKSAERCRASHIWNVEALKNFAAFWREGHCQVKMRKTLQLRGKVEMLKKCTRQWPKTHFEVKVLKTGCLGPLWKLGC